MAGRARTDPLMTLREYRQLAPWNINDLSMLAGAVLEASGVRPASAVASIRPNARTIRYYVARKLLMPPEGRGAAATYSYRHLLHVLFVKLRQMEGSTLADVAKELPATSGDALERQVAAALGPNLPKPGLLSIRDPAHPRGRSAQALHRWHALGDDKESDLQESDQRFAMTKWHRVPIVRGLELHVHEGHPLAKMSHRSAQIGDLVRRAVNRLLADQPEPF